MHPEQDRAYGSRRVTPQRRAIAEVVSLMSGAFTIDELVAEVRRRSPVAGATATVYRAVAAMVERGSMERVGMRDGSALYVACSDDRHHHHVICERCGMASATRCPVDTSAAGPEGFTITRHEVTLYGVCAECAIRGRA